VTNQATLSMSRTLLSVVHEAEAGRDESARALLAQLINTHTGTGAPDLLFCLFASALSMRLESAPTEEINLYLRQYPAAQISLFNVVAQKLPVAISAVDVTRTLLARFLGGQREVTLFDVGIGSGVQEVALLRLLAAQRLLPERLNVVAVEPDGPSLAVAQAALVEVAAELGVQLRFLKVPMVLEELADADWASAASFDAPLVVNASFVTHHIRCGQGSPLRDQIFRRFRELEPAAVVLTEPNANHHTASLAERFTNAWHHFGLVFRLIDELDVTAEDAAQMKMFFAREIEDIVANSEEQRCERHELVEVWVQRLRRAGFTPYSDFGFTRALSAERIRVTPHQGYVGLEYADETLVAVICATSA